MSRWLDGRIEIVTGDITRLDVEVIVNAANTGLAGGGGVDGAIHRAAGPELLTECLSLGGARTGEVKMTKGYRLRAKYIAHAVGPVWHGGGHGEPQLLASCYRKALELADDLGLHTVAFPSISTGVYRYPVRDAAVVAQTTVRDYLAEGSGLTCVTFCCFSESDARVYEEVAALVLE